MDFYESPNKSVESSFTVIKESKDFYSFQSVKYIESVLTISILILYSLYTNILIGQIHVHILYKTVKHGMDDSSCDIENVLKMYSHFFLYVCRVEKNLFVCLTMNSSKVYAILFEMTSEKSIICHKNNCMLLTIYWQEIGFNFSVIIRNFNSYRASEHLKEKEIYYKTLITARILTQIFITLISMLKIALKTICAMSARFAKFSEN